MTSTLIERDRRVIWHPFTQQKYSPEPIPIVRGEGIYLIDSEERTYLDAISSWWVNLHGHAHPYIAEKLYEQARLLEQVIFAGFTHLPAISLAERLLDILPGPFSKIFYSDNGSTSTEVALKMAIQYWKNKGDGKRIKILALTNAYHGDTFGAMSVSDRGIFTLAFHDYLFEVVFMDAPGEKPLPDLAWDEFACFIYEPLVQGAGGMKMYSADGLDRLLKKCREHHVICIADEVMTGFGRTGKLFASTHLEQRPDIICLSKGLTGGTMALGVTACTEMIYEAFVNEDKMKTFFHGHSFTANPLACATALASLDLLLQPSCQRSIATITGMNAGFAWELKENQAGLPVKDIRHLGTIIAFEVKEGADEYLNNISTGLTKKALERGVYLRPLGNTVYAMPPYCITTEELKRVHDVMREIIM